MSLLPLDQSAPHILPSCQRFVPESFLVTRTKSPIGMIPTRGALVELEEAPHVGLEVLAVFGIDSVGFPLGARCVEQGGDEELSETVQRRIELIRVNVEAGIRRGNVSQSIAEEE